ncbi:MAG: hypothetical protein K6A82_08195 [Prevotella sp.]|nr:hypothetical protein [Prevotella sp.]
MKKLVYICSVMALAGLLFHSCVDEEGAGVPRAKSMFVEHSEYNVNLLKDSADNLTLRWIDVGNAKYRVFLSNVYTPDTVEVQGQMQAGELSTLSMQVPYADLERYVENSGLLSGDYGSRDSIDIAVNVMGMPIDLNQPTALIPTGSTAKATIHFKK